VINPIGRHRWNNACRWPIYRFEQSFETPAGLKQELATLMAAVAKSEVFLMRKMLFASIAALAIVFGDLAVASAAPHIGDSFNSGNVSSLPNYNFSGG